MSAQQPPLLLEHVKRSFPLPNGDRLSVLRDVNMQVNEGEVVAIVGRSGSGKSTLLNVLGLLDVPSSGRYLCNGTDVSTLSDTARSRLRATSLGFVFQQFHLLDRRSALDNVAEPLLLGNRTEVANRHRRAAELLDAVGLRDRANAHPNVLSGGEQQRVAIARALVRNPRILLADEPTGALDVETGERVLNLLFDLVRAQGASMVLVTHDLEVAKRSDRTLLLTAGTLLESNRTGAA